MCGDFLPKQIKIFYGYYEKIALLDGYPNIKGYFEHALIRNSFPRTQFVSESMLEAAKKISGPEKGNVKSQMDMMNLPNLLICKKRKF